MKTSLSRRELLKRLGLGAAAVALPFPLSAGPAPGSVLDRLVSTLDDTDEQRLAEWSSTVRDQARQLGTMTTGVRAVRIGELAVGTPYEAFTLESYIREGGNPVQREPLALMLTRFDCVTLVESCLAIARASSASAQPSWQQFGREVERMRYRGGRRRGYASRLHYFSEWISDGENRGLVRDLGEELGGIADPRPLRFMTEHRQSYPALASDSVFREIASMEQRLDKQVRFMIPSDRIPRMMDRIESGDILAFATGIPGLDVSHAAFAYRDSSGTLRVLHAPLSGGSVEITRATLPEYVSNIRRATGIMVARPLRG